VRGALLLAALCGWSGPVPAQTDEIQVYDAEITAPGRFNLTWHNNFTPSGRTEPAFPGGIVGTHLGHFDFILNPIVDTDFKGGAGNLQFVTAVRAAWNFNGKLALALEEYADFGTLQHFKPSEQQSHTLFAVIKLILMQDL
jgi:hypothetical protein